MTIKLIIFDFDGTLGDTRRNIVATMQMTINELQLPSRTETECASTIGLPLTGCFRALYPDLQEGLIPRCAETYRRIFNENMQKITPEAFPGVVKTLKTLKEQGFVLTIASSRSHKSLTELTHQMGIADYISYLIGADDVKEAKPKPEPVLKTLDAMQFEAHTDRLMILLDTGASDVFIRNAEQLGIDLSAVDYVFISHGHSDHAGGLRNFLEYNQKAQVIVSPDAMSGKFFSKRGNLHSITTEWPEIGEDRLVLIDQTCEILEGLHVIAHIPQTNPMPKGNRNLYVQDANGDYIHDNFRHELALYVDGLLFTGCAHSGLENILSACPWPVHSVVGGFHLLDGQETDDEIKALAQGLKAKYPETQFYTSHCTGDNVFGVMKDVMDEQLQSFRCGTVIA